MPTHKNTPAFHERAAHIAERAMPVCKGMAKLYPMIYKKTNTIFERILICLYIKVPYNCKPTERETAFNNARM